MSAADFHACFKVLQAWLIGLHGQGALAAHQQLMLHFDAEQSDYVRLNQSRVRQAGQVTTLRLTMVLVEKREAGALVQVQTTFNLEGSHEADRLLLTGHLEQLLTLLPALESDPHLVLNEEPSTSEQILESSLPSVEVIVDTIRQATSGEAGAAEAGATEADLVGFLARGPRARGMLSTLGHAHYQSRDSYFFDFSVYAGGLIFPKPVEMRDKAVKQSMSDVLWKPDLLVALIRDAIAQASVLLRPAKRLTPGSYRAWLAPAAVSDLLDMLCWGGFSLRSLRHGASPLEAAYGGLDGQAPLSQRRHFSPLFSLDDAPGLAGVPRFQAEGFLGPERIALVQQGQATGLLVSPRSGLEFGAHQNGQDQSEAPRALRLMPGDLDEREAMKALGTGLFISNLWYLNFSDRLSCSVTGMTRFASLWVENGEPVAPLSAMRIDDSLYDVFGGNLQALGAVSHMIPDVSTYDLRAFGGSSAPGALLSSLRLAL